MRRSVSNAFMASLGVTNEEKVSYVTISEEDLNITKYAGMYISNPTHENVEEFIRKYMLSELSFFPKVLDVSIEIIPSEMDNSNKEHIAEASGVIGIKLHKKNIEIPFLFRDGELMPFDVIQMDGQRVPFSRENLMKLIVNLDKEITNKNKGGLASGPYLGSEQPINPSTVAGFMSDVMQIRDSYVNKKGGGMYVTADEKIIDLDSLLDKVANLKPMSNEQKEAIAYVLNKKAHERACEELEKLASEAENNELTRKDMKSFKKAEDVKFVDIKSIAHGKCIVFPEIKDDELSLTPGIVLKNTDNNAGNDMSILVVANDGRYKTISGNDKFLCAEAPGAAFKLPTTELRALDEDNSFFALKENDMVGPYKLTNHHILAVSHEDSLKQNNLDKFTNLRVAPITTRNSRDFFTPAPSNKSKTHHKSILLLPEKKFEKMKYEDTVKAIVQISGLDKNKVEMIAHPYTISNGNNEVLCSDPHTKVFKLKTELVNYVETREDLDNFYKLASTGHKSIEKIASTDNIRIECIDRKQKLFNLSINYRDTDKRFMNARRQNFNRISEGKLKAILHIMKFQTHTIKEIIYKSKNEPRCTYPIPYDCTSEDIKKIEGGNLTNISAKHVQATVNKLINPSSLVTGLATGVVTGLASDAVSGLAKSQAGYEVFKFMKKLSSTTEALSSQFEKLAQEHENEDYLDYARLTAISHYFVEKTASVMKDTDNVYPDILTVAKDIKDALPLFEKVAFDMTNIKNNQVIGSYEEINPNYLKEAILALDNTYKIACTIEKTVDKTVRFM